MIDRRFFLQILAGATAGSLAAGAGKWVYDSFSTLHRENFVVPSGKESFVHGVCQLCHGGCGLKVRKIEERVVAVHGRTDHPVNAGGICPVGLLAPVDLYHPLRLRKCMKRSGSSWHETTWDQAFSEIIPRLRASRGPWVWIGDENSVTVNALAGRVLSLRNSPHYYHASLKERFTYGPFQLSHGIEKAPALDLENTRTIFSFGDSFLEDFSAPPWVMNIYGSRRPDDITLLYAGTGSSATAQKADFALKANPGTLGFVALGIIYTILSQRFYDPFSVTRHSTDFREFQEFVLGQYDLGIVSKITGVSVPLIIRAAHLFMEKRPNVALAGDDVALELNGSWSQGMVHALNMLVGSINVPGGIGVQEPLPLAPLEPALEKEALSFHPRAFPYERIAELQEAGVVFLANANLLYDAPRPEMIERWLEHVPLVVAFATHRLPSFQNAHYLLPIRHFLEGFADAGPPPWFPHLCLSLSSEGRKPDGECKDLRDLLLEMSRPTLPDGERMFPWKDGTELSRELYSGLISSAGIAFGSAEEKLWHETLQMSGLWRPIYKDRETFWREITERSGWFKKVTLPQSWDKIFSRPAAGFQFRPLIKPEEPLFLGDEISFPLILQPLSVHYASHHSEHLPFLGLLNFPDRDAQFAIPAIISPEEGHRLGLKDRERAHLITEGGRVEVLVLFSEDVQASIAYVVFGLSPHQNPNRLFMTSPERKGNRRAFQRCRLDSL